MTKYEFNTIMFDPDSTNLQKFEACAKFISTLEKDLEYYKQKYTEASWKIYPDRSGGAFSEKEINDRGWN